MSSRAGLIGLLQGRRVEHCLLATPAGGWALVVPRLAARVLAAGLDERNALWVSPSLERCLEGLDWNAGGQRTWLAPELGPRGFFGAGESDWAVPPALDPGAFRLEEARSSSASCRGDCRIASADGAEYRLEITRQVEISDLPGKPPGGAVLLRIRHSLRNTGRTAIAACAGLWSIVQLPCSPEGTLLLPDLPYRSYFGDLPAAWMSRQAGRLELRTAPGRRYKVGQRPPKPEARLAHRRREAAGETLVLMRCPCSPEGLYLDGPLAEPGAKPGSGDALQAYNSPLSGREAFCELECHAPASRLAPGESNGQAVDIEIRYGT